MKKPITILAVLLLLSTTAFAAEYPSQVSYSMNNGIFEVRKTYELPVDQEPSMQAKQSFEQDGYSFTLTDLLRQELPEQQAKEYTETVTVSSESKELTAILPLLADTKAVTTEDGFTGTLKLDTGSITVEPAGYKNNSWTVSATRTYPNLSSMDLEYIPKTTTENGRTLNFSTVDWQTDNTENVDDDAIGDRFSAIVTYTGTASSRNVTGYTVTAQYSGEVEKVSLNKVQYVAVFHGTPLVVPEVEVEEAPTMKQFWTQITPLPRTAKLLGLTLLTATVLTATPALALEYTEADAAAGSFGKPTSVEPVTVVGGSNIYETDVSKNAAYIPPAFGSPMADMPGSGERLTPNLLTGGYLESGTASSGTTGTATVMPPAAETPSNSGTTWSSGYTAVTSSLYYKDGSLGTLSAPAIGLSAKIYQGTDNAAMRKGAGHFTETSIWDGNVAFAGHNRGSSNYFGKIHTLKNGNTIKLTTRLGARTYSVYSVRKVSVNDVSVLNPTTDNVVTLVTCVMNQPQYRWCVQARQK